MHIAEGWPEAVRDWATTPVLLLAVGPQAQRGGWAGNAAIEIADALAAAGDRVILADLSLDNPELHDLAGIDNTEGLTDVFLFGASLEHVTRMLPAHSFELIPAAAFTPDAEEILTHRRWSVLFEDYAASKTKLLLYLPITVDGVGALSDRVGHTVVLAEEGEVQVVQEALSVDAELVGVFSPPKPPDEIAPIPEPEPEPEPEVIEPVAEAVAEAEVEPLPLPVDEPETVPVPVAREPSPSLSARIDDKEFEKIRIPKDSAREALIADLRARQRAALMAPPPTLPPLSDEVDVVRAKAPPRTSSGFPPPKIGIHEPTFASRVREKPKAKTPVFAILLVLLMMSSAAAAWHYWGVWRNGKSVNGGSPQAGPTPVSPTPRFAGSPAQPLPYSVAIAGYQVLEQANEFVEQLKDAESQMQFYVAPSVVQGALFYRVFAGPLPDSATAAAVRDTLVAHKIKTVSLPGNADLVAAPFAFLIGTFPRRADAEAKAAEVATKLIPTYIVQSATLQGTEYKLYAGAYSGPGDADFMREILEQASLPDTLVERTGSIRS